MRRPPTVLITGCSTGIGAALVEAFAAAGCRVVATARDPERIPPLVNGRRYALDVNDSSQIHALVTRLREEGEQIDILVNNAGYGAMGPLLHLSEAALRQQFETNVVGLMAVTRACLPAMIARGSGRIVNIGSVSGILVTPFAGAYCASKAAVHALSDALRMELAPLGIDVIIVQPGAIRSQFGATAIKSLLSNERGSSPYGPISTAIDARAGASQHNSTPAAQFARQMVRGVLRRRPPAVLRIGHGSSVLPALARWLPLAWRDALLSRRFQLTHLGKETGGGR